MSSKISHTTPSTTSTPSTKPTPTNTPNTQRFIDSLSLKEKKAYKIAKDFLETSFDMKKSIGFKKWWATSNSTT